MVKKLHWVVIAAVVSLSCEKPWAETTAAVAAQATAELECAYAEACPDVVTDSGEGDYGVYWDDLTTEECVAYRNADHMAYERHCRRQGVVTFDGCGWAKCTDDKREAMKTCSGYRTGCALRHYFPGCDFSET